MYTQWVVLSGIRISYGLWNKNVPQLIWERCMLCKLTHTCIRTQVYISNVLIVFKSLRLNGVNLIYFPFRSNENQLASAVHLVCRFNRTDMYMWCVLYSEQVYWRDCTQFACSSWGIVSPKASKIANNVKCLVVGHCCRISCIPVLKLFECWNKGILRNPTESLAAWGRVWQSVLTSIAIRPKRK